MSDLIEDTHCLLNLVRVTQAPEDVREAASALIAQAAALLQPHAYPGPYAVEQLAPPGDGHIVFDASDLRQTVPYSPLLGHQNPTAPASHCRAVDGALVGDIAFSPVHAGPMGQVHGSVIAGLFDEILALSMLASGEVGYTRTLEVKYLRPTPLGTRIDFSAECGAREDKTLHAQAQISAGGKVTATATATFAWVASMDQNFYAARGER
jgi:acyl-coenzyme A thioesterase PaaI-like protein